MTNSDQNRISDDQHNNAPAVPQGWKLVPVEPTLALLDAGWGICGGEGHASAQPNRQKIKIAAANYRAMLAATPAPAPAQESGESVQLRGLDDSSAMLRVRTILESKACYLAGSTIAEIVAAAQPAQEVGLTDEQKTWAVNQLMEQAQVFASAWSLVGGRHDFGNALEEAEQAKTELRSMVVEALRAKGGK